MTEDELKTTKLYVLLRREEKRCPSEVVREEIEVLMMNARSCGLDLDILATELRDWSPTDEEQKIRRVFGHMVKVRDARDL